MNDPLFAWAMGQIHPQYQVKQLSTFGGWLVPARSENLLWGAIAQTHGTTIICPQCFHEALPCEAWINIVTKRFEDAHAVQREQAKWQLGGGYGDNVNRAYQRQDDYYGQNSYSRNPGYKEQSYPPDWRSPLYTPPYTEPKRQKRRTGYSQYQPPPYQRPYQAPHQAPYQPPYQPPPKPAPKKPEPTREERLSAAAHTLGITWPTTKDQIKLAFVKAVMKAHPDMGGTDAAFIRVKQARDTLTANV